jgi:hypothetical protein
MGEARAGDTVWHGEDRRQAALRRDLGLVKPSMRRNAEE